MSDMSTIDPGRARLAELLAKKALGRGAAGAAVAQGHAIAETTGTAVTAAPTAAPMAVISNFVMSKGGKGKLRVSADCVFSNSDGAAHQVAIGIKIVAHGAGAPTTWDYPPPPPGVGSNGVTVPAGGQAGSSILCDYGGATGGNTFPAALTPGNAYDIYLMATSNDTHQQSLAHSGQIACQEQL